MTDRRRPNRPGSRAAFLARVMAVRHVLWAAGGVALVFVLSGGSPLARFIATFQ